MANCATPTSHWSRLAALVRRIVLGGIAPIAGYLLATSPVSGLYASGTGNLSEASGGESVQVLTVTGSADNWTSCDGINCTSVARYVRVGWSINDTSTFYGIWANRADAGVACQGDDPYKQVNAGAYSSGYDYLYMYTNPYCTIGYGVYWDWRGGMCDTLNECYYDYAQGNGPHIAWLWIPPSGSATSFQYRW